jgi:1-acyl-sn-glycerol-3-phosphate acyltransferase
LQPDADRAALQWQHVHSTIAAHADVIPREHEDRRDRIHPGWRARQTGIFARACAALLHLAGWRLVLDIPPLERAVIVFYPHTTNWDFVIGLLARFALAVPVTWAGKDTLFRWPFATMWRRLGGIPVNRRQSTGFVAQMIDAFAGSERLLLAIAPEGTRRRTAHWKSGFYRVALGAGVPLALSFIDFKRKAVGVGALVMPTGDAATDFAALRAFYADKSARHPEQAAPIVLESETRATP